MEVQQGNGKKLAPKTIVDKLSSTQLNALLDDQPSHRIWLTKGDPVGSRAFKPPDNFQGT